MNQERRDLINDRIKNTSFDAVNGDADGKLARTVAGIGGALVYAVLELADTRAQVYTSKTRRAIELAEELAKSVIENDEYEHEVTLAERFMTEKTEVDQLAGVIEMFEASR